MRRLLLVLVLSWATLGVSYAQPIADTSPLPTLYSYYTQINLGNYATAFDLRTDPTPNFRDFVAGFADTESVLPYFGAFQPSGEAQTGRVPAVVIGYRTDDTIQAFAGCFVMENVLGRWRILNSTLQPLPFGGSPNDATIRAYLGVNCFNPASVGAVQAPATGAAADSVRAYFTAINNRNFVAAYGLWLSTIVDYRPPFESFVSGYDDTLYVYVYTGTFVSTATTFIDGYLPVVLVSQQTDGSVTGFTGCYVMSFAGDRIMRIVDGQFSRFGGDSPPGDQIRNALNVDCTAFAGSL